MNLIHHDVKASHVASAIATLLYVASLSGCGSDTATTNTSLPDQTAGQTTLSCDDSIKTGFKPDANTTVLLVKAFKKGEPLLLTGSPTATTPTAANDLCLVKLNVGPGNPGPADAPSTSPGIGIEVWLPAKQNWNGRFHATGNGGFGGSTEGSITALSGIGAANDVRRASAIAGTEGAVTASENMGHTDPTGSGSWAMNPDGTINTVLWRDFSERSVHEMAVKAKALATAYYGSAPKYSYFDGASTGGRQALKAAQANPADFDGIISAVPAINWTKFTTAELYPQIVWQRDLVDKGIPIPTYEQQDLVSNAAINACDVVGEQHLGYILDQSQCGYDPTKDAKVLCPGVVGNGGVVGASTSPSCVNVAQAQAINKIWYGPTADGNVPAPAIDNGWNVTLSGAQKWYGLPRGTSLYQASFTKATGLPFGLANPNAAFSIGTDMVALELQNSKIAGPGLRNATGNGVNGWKSLSYSQFSNAFDQGVVLQPQFANINTDNPDLTAFKNRGGKILHYHGVNDELIFSQGSVNYYNRVLNQMGGMANVQNFYRFFLVPGNGHGSVNATSNEAATPPTFVPGQMYKLMTDWVEKGIVPDRINLNSLPGSPTPISQPICPYPQKATYRSGDPKQAASYTCS
ncbi:tannase/feruloyl esterase family alpha/beta hydrolase [Noviherbaspirillum saxi]|uniref:Tannase/feruloyl esterase family alpha/beta hydrolase n=1 Tax=Noviherbaspirillum saxi TaxID=2320863 RepID=A0A3A3FK37_9BURK|nr:tannase/feruloyl esterase family alpha/beta hydrolase [Noviherbaspirillum saxi]RJF95071.1 tannase/feruloyl esterase family alpha/beta hydrolase [Noviherbaspirillum saxi]